MMKSKLIVFLSIFFLKILTVTGSQQPNDGFVLNGLIEGLKDGTKLELVPRATHSKTVKAFAQSTVENGTFLFKGKLDGPRLFTLKIADSKTMIMPIMLDNNSKVELTGKSRRTKTPGRERIIFGDLKVKGSEVNDLFKKKMAFKDSMGRTRGPMLKPYDAVAQAYNKAYVENNKEKMDSIKNSAAYKAMEEAQSNFLINLRSVNKSVIAKNGDSFWGPLIMLESMWFFTPEQKPYYELFSQEAKDSYYGKIVYKKLFEENMKNKLVPLFELPDREDEMIQSANLMKGKKYVLIDFWASWCGPCRKEIPNLKRLYEEFSPKGLEIISVSIDDNKAAWLKALDQENMPWPNLLDDKDLDSAFFIQSIPALFLVNEKGIVIENDIRGEELHEMIKGLL